MLRRVGHIVRYPIKERFKFHIRRLHTQVDRCRAQDRGQFHVNGLEIGIIVAGHFIEIRNRPFHHAGVCRLLIIEEFCETMGPGLQRVVSADKTELGQADNPGIVHQIGRRRGPYAKEIVEKLLRVHNGFGFHDLMPHVCTEFCGSLDRGFHVGICIHTPIILGCHGYFQTSRGWSLDKTDRCEVSLTFLAFSHIECLCRVAHRATDGEANANIAGHLPFIFRDEWPTAARFQANQTTNRRGYTNGTTAITCMGERHHAGCNGRCCATA